MNAVEEFLQFKNSGSLVKESINRGLDVYQKLESVSSSSLFMLNEENFNFDFRDSNGIARAEIIRYFDLFIDEGIIGKALQSTKTYIDSAGDYDFFDKPFCIIPMVSTSGLVGIIIIIFKEMPVDSILFRVFSMFANLLATYIRNAGLVNQMYNTKEFFEQEVAARTIHLEQKKRELNAIFESVHTGILVIDDKTNRITKINDTAKDLIKAKENDIIDTEYLEYLDFKDIHNSTDIDDIKLEKNYESVLHCKDGTNVPIIRTTSLINLGRQLYRIETFLDISKLKEAEKALMNSNELLELKVQERTEDLLVLVHKLKEQIAVRKKAEEEVRKMLEKEKELSELKTRFVSMVSHEFRTPLTVIRSSAQLLKKYDDKLHEEDKKDYLDKMIKTVDYMKELIENVIFIGQSESESINIRASEIDVREFFREISKDVKLTHDPDRDIKITFDGDRKKAEFDSKIIRNIFVNILANAMKYSSPETEIDVDIALNEKGLYFTVIDRGIGITEDEQEKIFELFYRGKNVGSISGTGLGLAVVATSLKKLNGNIEISSKLQKGSKFKVFIPLKKRFS